MDLTDKWDPRFCVWPAGLFLYSRPWFDFYFFCLTAEEKAGVIKRTVTEAFEVFRKEIAERSGETVGSLLLEIVIMLG